MQGRMRAISDIVNALIAGVKAGQDVNLNAVKQQASRKYSLSKFPKLVEIIAALPEEYRQELLPQ
jgi:elongator complex protein 3